MAAGSIVIDLLMRTGSFETDSKRAEKRLNELNKTARRAGAAIGTALVAGATVAVTALKLTIDKMDELSKAAQRASLPTEEFTRLAYAGSLADVSVEDITKSLGKLAKAQGDAQAGLKTQTDAFKQLGIDFEDANGHLRSTKDVFLDFADVFQKYQGTPEVVAAGMQIFGRSFQTLIPLLKDGSAGLKAAADESDRFGNTLSTKAGKEAEAFNDNITRLKTVMSGLIKAVAEDLLPDLLTLSERFVKSATSGDKLKDAAHGIAEGIREIVNLADDIRAFFAPFVEFGKNVATLQNKIEALGRASNALFRGNAADFDKAISDYENAADKIAQGAKKYENTFSGGPQFKIPGLTPQFNATDPIAPYAFKEKPRLPSNAPEPKGGSGKSKSSGADDAKRAAEEALRAQQESEQALRDQIAAVAEARKGFESYAAQLAGPVADANYQYAEDQKRLNELASQGEISTEQLTKAQGDLAKAHEETLKAIDARLNPGKQLLKDIQDEITLVGLSNENQEIYNNLKYAGVAANSALGQSIIETTQQLQAAREEAAFLDDLKSGLSDMFVDFVSGAKTAKEAFGDFADAIYKRALQFVADKAIQALFDSFGSGGTSGASSGSGGGGFWASLIGAFAGGKAVGGDVMSNRSYLVGEQGPELFTPRTAGAILPAQQTAMAMGGGGNTVVQNNQFLLPRRIDNRNQQQVAQAAGTAAQTAIRRNGR